MRRLLLCSLFVFAASVISYGQQTDCPSGKVCFTQEQANSIFDRLSQLVAAKDALLKLQAERMTADTALANALKVVDGWKEMNAVNEQIILKKDQIITLYERVMQMQTTIIDNLEKRMMKGRSAWQKFVAVVEKIGVLLAGIALGRGL